MTLLTLDHLKAHNEHEGQVVHTAQCTREWFDRFGLDFRDFVKNGIPLSTVKDAVPPDDPGLTRFLTFLETLPKE